jgi:hypothetical protein
MGRRNRSISTHPVNQQFRQNKVEKQQCRLTTISSIAKLLRKTSLVNARF